MKSIGFCIHLQSHGVSSSLEDIRIIKLIPCAENLSSYYALMLDVKLHDQYFVKIQEISTKANFQMQNFERKALI